MPPRFLEEGESYTVPAMIEGEWVYGFYKYHPYYEIPMIEFWEEVEELEDVPPCGIWKSVEVIPETVGQFTGLKDKNGKEIYEGDIWEIDNTHEKIIFEEFSGAFKPEDENGECYETDQLEAKQLEVIGNIHTNPELLE